MSDLRERSQRRNSPATRARLRVATAAMARGTIRYWAAARAAAGIPEEQYDGSTLADVLAMSVRSHGPDLARVFSVASFIVDGVRSDPAVALVDGATIEVLPPFAGG